MQASLVIRQGENKEMNSWFITRKDYLKKLQSQFHMVEWSLARDRHKGPCPQTGLLQQ